METRKIPNLGCNSGRYPLPFLCAPKLKYPKEVADIRDIRDIETNKRYQELGNDYYFVPLGIIGVIQGNWGVTRNNQE